MTATSVRSQPIATIDRRDGEQVRVQWGEFNGVPFLDLRLYFRDPSGDWRPTRKGITVRPDQLDELASAINAARTTAPRRDR